MKPLKCNDMKKVILTIVMLPLTMLMSTVAFAQVPENITVNQVDDQLYEVSLYFEDGSLLEKGYMLDGRFTGLWVRYNEKGMVVAEASYDNGAKDGTWRIFTNDGQLAYELEYDNNVRIMARTFDNTGNPISYRMN